MRLSLCLFFYFVDAHTDHTPTYLPTLVCAMGTFLDWLWWKPKDDNDGNDDDDEQTSISKESQSLSLGEANNPLHDDIRQLLSRHKLTWAKWVDFVLDLPDGAEWLKAALADPHVDSDERLTLFHPSKDGFGVNVIRAGHSDRDPASVAHSNWRSATVGPMTEGEPTGVGHAFEGPAANGDLYRGLFYRCHADFHLLKPNIVCYCCCRRHDDLRPNGSPPDAYPSCFNDQVDPEAQHAITGKHGEWGLVQRSYPDEGYSIVTYCNGDVLQRWTSPPNARVRFICSPSCPDPRFRGLVIDSRDWKEEVLDRPADLGGGKFVLDWPAEPKELAAYLAYIRKGHLMIEKRDRPQAIEFYESLARKMAG